MTRFLSLASLALVALAGAAQEAAFDGKWTVNADIAGTTSQMTCTFSQKGADSQKAAELKGTCQGDGSPLLVTGTSEGRTVTWQFDVDWEGQTLTLVYTGTLESAEKMLGSVEVQPMGVTGAFAASRTK